MFDYMQSKTLLPPPQKKKKIEICDIIFFQRRPNVEQRWTHVTSEE